jgi:hypothetical protein
MVVKTVLLHREENNDEDKDGGGRRVPGWWLSFVVAICPQGNKRGRHLFL